MINAEQGRVIGKLNSLCHQNVRNIILTIWFAASLYYIFTTSKLAPCNFI